MKRCAWVNPEKELDVDYHDNEWGVPVHDDQKLFEMLVLEGAQAGLSWQTILKRRDGYRHAFKKFDPAKVAKMTDAQLEELMQDQSIIRNRLKIFSARKNALVFLQIQKEFGSFDNYVWQFVNGKTIIDRPTKDETPAPTSTQSDALSKDLKKRGMSFVGGTIMHAYLLAVGLIDGHARNCFWAKT